MCQAQDETVYKSNGEEEREREVSRKWGLFNRVII